MSRAYKVYSTRETPQNQLIPGSTQVANSAGGYAFAVDDWKRLDRFICLGSEGGTYYIKEKALTLENADAVKRCIDADGHRVVARVAEISDAGRAPKNDPALFVLAMCAGLGDTNTRRYAFEVLPSVARIGTHLFHFIDYVQQSRGWGRGLRNAVANWYNSKTPDNLAYQVVKYQQRDKWSHRDVLRLAGPAPVTDIHNAIYRWIVTGGTELGQRVVSRNSSTKIYEALSVELPKIIVGFERAKIAQNAKEVATLIRDYGLPREAVPTQFLTEKVVWDALLESMPMTAMIRNLANMTRIGVVEPMSDGQHKVVDELSNDDRIKKARMHPLQVLVALKTYQEGKGERSDKTWIPNQKIVDALDGAFYKAFGNVESAGKRTLICLDVSGSMGWGQVAGMTGITPRVGSAAMALVTEATEPENHVMGFSHQLVPINVSARMRLDTVVSVIEKIPMGGTDCSLPMVWALDSGVKIDTFIVYTDSETWAGKIHPVQALRKYRDKMGIPAELIVVGMMSNGFTIADPSDAGMLDIVGYDTATPQVMADFSAGRI